MELSTNFASRHPWLWFMKPYRLLDSLMRGQFSLLRIIDESHSINRFNTKYVLLFIRGYIISIKQHPRKGAGLLLLTSRDRQRAVTTQTNTAPTNNANQNPTHYIPNKHGSP